MLVDPTQIIIVGEETKADEFEALGIAQYAVNKTVVRFRPNQLVAGELPESLLETVLQVPRPDGEGAWALICRGRTCMSPITDVETLLKALE